MAERDEMGHFLPGHKEAKGRGKGTLNKTTAIVRDFARSILEDEAYRKNVKKRAIAGDLGALEVTLYHYAYGKPKETVDMNLEHTVYLVELD